MRVKELILELAEDPYNPVKNFAIAEEYYKIEQLTSAASFYLRTAEYGYHTHPLYVYSALLKMAMCFDRQNNRDATSMTSYYHAVTYLPNRPEAYFYLSRRYEKLKEWNRSYTFASIGLMIEQSSYRLPLPTTTDYHGIYCLLFEKAVVGWWLGYKEESKELFINLLDEHKMTPEYVHGCMHNMRLFKDVS